MRDLRPDEIELIERVRKRKHPLDFTDESGRSIGARCLRTLTPVSTDPSDSLQFRFTGLTKINDHPIHMNSFKEYMKEIGPSGPNISIPPVDFPQEEPLDQIERMIDDLPDDDICKSHGHKCPWMGGLVISSWARGFLRQLVREHKGRVK